MAQTGAWLSVEGDWSRGARGVGLVALYVAGLVQWATFFGFGNLSLKAYDWPKEHLYLHVLRDAVRGGDVPYHVQVPRQYAEAFPQFVNHDAGSVAPSRFLALPETVLSPQLILLRFMDEGKFVCVHFLLLYSAGFYGCMWLGRRYKLSLIPFAVLFVLFNFNGYITSHLGVGHAMCGGYFFLPFVGLYILEWMEAPGSAGPGFKLAMVFFVMLLQGSLHVVVWCWLFVALVVAWNPRAWRAGFIAVALGALLGGVRLVPAAFAFWGFRLLNFGGGYPTLTTVLEACLLIRDPTYRFFGGIFWWEYDIYVGLLGLAFLGYFGVYRRFGRDAHLLPYRYAPLDVPLILMAFLSLSDFYFPVFNLPVPLLNSERVTSRFIVIPFVLLLVIAAIRMQKILESMNLGFKGHLLLGVGVLEMWRSLLTHAAVWSVPRLELEPTSYWHELTTATVVEAPDRAYFVSLYLGAAVSVFALVLWSYGRFRLLAAKPTAAG
jgi:hypothetical protein